WNHPYRTGVKTDTWWQCEAALQRLGFRGDLVHPLRTQAHVGFACCEPVLRGSDAQSQRHWEYAIRYFFHLRVGRELSVDELGVELPDLDTAYLEAFQAAQEMWGELLAEKSDPLLRSFEIADASGRLLLTLP